MSFYSSVFYNNHFLLFLLDEPVGSESLRMIEAEPVMFMFTDSSIRIYSSITMNVSPSKEIIGYTAEFPPALIVTLSCSLPYTLHLTDSSLHSVMLRLALRPDNIDSWAELQNPRNLSYFFPILIHFPVRFSQGSSLSSIPLFLLFLLPPSACPLRGSGIRGIPEGDFPCFLVYQYGP